MVSPSPSLRGRIAIWIGAAFAIAFAGLAAATVATERSLVAGLERAGRGAARRASRCDARVPRGYGGCAALSRRRRADTRGRRRFALPARGAVDDVVCVKGTRSSSPARGGA